MEYRLWTDSGGKCPVLDELCSIEKADFISGKSYKKHLQKLKKYNYAHLARHRIIKKLEGRNPFKIHELRFALPHTIARTFFVVARDSTMWLLHLMIKKKDKTLSKDIAIAEQRASLVNQEISYL